MGPYAPLHLKPLYISSKVHLMAYIYYSPKSLQKIVLPENVFISIFYSDNDEKVPKLSYFIQIWPIMGPKDPLKYPLQYMLPMSGQFVNSQSFQMIPPWQCLLLSEKWTNLIQFSETTCIVISALYLLISKVLVDGPTIYL